MLTTSSASKQAKAVRFEASFARVCMSVLLKPCSTIQSNLTIRPPPAMTSDEKQHQKRTVSLEIPPDAAPGDSLCFVVDGIELELCVPEGARPSDLLEISVGGSPVLSSFREEATVERNNGEVTRVPLANDKTLVLSHQIPIRKEETKVPNSENADGTHAMAWPAGLELVNCIQESRSSDLEQVIKESDSVLELGSGLGVVGLAMAVATDNKTKTICLTDCQSAMPLLEHNVQQNQHLIARNVTFHTRSLNWEQQDNEDAQKFDLIVGSDVLYNINLIPALVATLKRHTKTFILLATRWRKPDLERRFFEDTNEFVDWKLVDLLTCKLSWKDYGNPTNSESNAYFWQTTVAVNGILKPLAEISEEDTTQMCKEEHDAWERLQIQVYIGKVKVIAGDDEPNTKRARVDS